MVVLGLRALHLPFMAAFRDDIGDLDGYDKWLGHSQNVLASALRPYPADRHKALLR